MKLCILIAFLTKWLTVFDSSNINFFDRFFWRYDKKSIQFFSSILKSAYNLFSVAIFNTYFIKKILFLISINCFRQKLSSLLCNIECTFKRYVYDEIMLSSMTAWSSFYKYVSTNDTFYGKIFQRACFIIR